MKLPLFVIKDLESGFRQFVCHDHEGEEFAARAAGHHLDQGITLLPYKHNSLKAFDEHPIALNSDE